MLVFFTKKRSIIFHTIDLRINSWFIVLFIFLVSCTPSYNQNAKFLYRVNDYPISRLVWSPSGEHLAFSSVSVSKVESTLYILKVEKGEAQAFVRSDYGWVLPQSWTPDGKGLLFYANSSHEFKDGIWLADVSDAIPPRFLLQDGINATWSSTGLLVVSRKNPNGGIVISVQDLNTNKETPLFIQSAVAINSLAWSTDGSKLAFSLDNGEFRKRDIYVIDLVTQESHQITSVGTNDSPSLSPNGNMVAYVKGNFSGTAPYYSFHIMNSDGSCDMEVPGLVDIESPAWSPDGNQIAFVGKGNRIFLLNVVITFGQDILAKGISC